MSEAKAVKQDGRSPRRTFTLEFKQQAVRLLTEEKYTFKAAAIAAGLAIDKNVRVQDVAYDALLENLATAKQIVKPETGKKPPAPKGANN